VKVYFCFPVTIEGVAMHEDGWFAIKRGLLKHPIFKPKGPYSRAEAWIWMIENACFSDTKIDLHGEMITVKRGQLCFSVRKLAEEWKWGYKAARIFLSRLEQENVVNLDASKKGRSKGATRTLITICNYEKYQSVKESRGAKGGARGAQEGRTKEQGNNYSEPNGSAASAAPDPEKLMFDAGVQLLCGAGLSECNARSNLGRWKKNFGTAAVIAAIGAAQRTGAIEPVGYIDKCLRNARNRSGRTTDDGRVVYGDAFGGGEVVR
jgi:hypothetical protein